STATASCTRARRAPTPTTSTSTARRRSSVSRQPPERSAAIEDRAFLLLLAVVTVAFAWIVWPFYGAVLWGAAIAIVFAPLERRLGRRLHDRKSLAAVAT